jgi:hypothetical protein
MYYETYYEYVVLFDCALHIMLKAEGLWKKNQVPTGGVGFYVMLRYFYSGNYHVSIAICEQVLGFIPSK